MESTPQQTAEGKAVVTVLAAVLERLVKAKPQSPAASNSNATPPEVTKFHALKAPGITIKEYLERIHKYASCSTECFVLALIYIDRLIQNNNFILSELNVHRVVITAILLAAKFFDDAYYNNAYYAKVGGVLVSEMNGLEVEFLFRINFSLHVKHDVFIKYQDELVSHAVGAGLEQHQQLQLQQHQQQQQQNHESIGMTGNMSMEQTPNHQQQQIQQPQFMGPVPTVVAGANQNISQTITSAIPCGNVTPSPPPQSMDCSQPHQQPLQDMNSIQYQHPQNNIYQHQQPQKQHQSIQVIPIQQPSQQQTVVVPPQPSKNYQIQNNANIIIHPTSTADVLFNACCPYGNRLNPNPSSSGLFNTVTRIYQ